MGIGISMAESQLPVATAGDGGNYSWIYYPVDRAGGRFLDSGRGTDTVSVGLLLDYSGGDHVPETGEAAVGWGR